MALQRMKIERLGQLKTLLGECPVWFAQQLWLMDCRMGSILALDPDTGEVCERLEVPAPSGCFAFHAKGGIIVSLKEEVALLEPRTGRLRALARIEHSHPQLRLNDGTALADGSFVVGTMHVLREPGDILLGGVYRLDTDLNLQKIEEALGVANGPAVNPVNHRFHIADSAARVIYSYAMTANGTLSDRRIFVRTEELGSGPDGCCFDDAGGLWTALVRSGGIARFDLQGGLTHRIELPLTHPSSLCFGGENMDTLFVTSISDSGRLSAAGPLDGAVLKLTGSGFRGQPRPLCRMGL